MQKAPDFDLLDQDGTLHTLHDYAGKWLVLYFYPKDNTTGCTTEACNFRDQREAIAELGNAVIVGVSTDSVESHRQFANEFHLNFTLLSDPDHTVIAAYDSWQPQKFLGKEFLGTKRNTYIIDPAGNIAKKYEGVDPKKHATEIIQDLKSLQSAR